MVVDFCWLNIEKDRCLLSSLHSSPFMDSPYVPITF
jgi:hypothetical protein